MPKKARKSAISDGDYLLMPIAKTRRTPACHRAAGQRVARELARSFGAPDQEELVRRWLLGCRTVELDDASENGVSSETTTMMIERRHVVRCRLGQYWITSVAANRYGLPKVGRREFPTPKEVESIWKNDQALRRQPKKGQLLLDFAL